MQGGCAAIVVPGVDLIRIWVGPLPSYVCTLAIMAKNYYFISITYICLHKFDSDEICVCMCVEKNSSDGWWLHCECNY